MLARAGIAKRSDNTENGFYELYLYRYAEKLVNG